MKTIGFLVLIAASVAISGNADAMQLKTFGSRGDLVSLNPQPLPPGEINGIIIVGGRGSKGSPKPLPPGEANGIIIVSGHGGEVSLNPQPLPPKQKFGLFSFN